MDVIQTSHVNERKGKGKHPKGNYNGKGKDGKGEPPGTGNPHITGEAYSQPQIENLYHLSRSDQIICSCCGGFPCNLALMQGL